MMGSVKRDKTVIFAGLLWIVQSVVGFASQLLAHPKEWGDFWTTRFHMSISDVFRNVSAFRHFRACSHLRIVGWAKMGFLDCNFG